jgi:hypothetical protein
MIFLVGPPRGRRLLSAFLESRDHRRSGVFQTIRTVILNVQGAVFRTSKLLCVKDQLR